MEGDSQIGGGGGELEGAASPDIPPQDASRDLIAVSDGQHVAVTDVQSEDIERETDRVRDTSIAGGSSSGQVLMTQSAVMSTDNCVGDKMTSKAKCCIHPQAKC